MKLKHSFLYNKVLSIMSEDLQQSNANQITPEVLKRAMKAFKKRLKLTSLDDDSRLGRGPVKCLNAQ